MPSPSVIIVGAGAGGLATAARLAQQGCKVKVFEKQGFVGGRCSLVSTKGYRFDQGPSLLLMPELFEETFRDLKTSLSEENLKILKCDPNYCIWFPDGDTVELSTDLSRLKKEVERHEGPNSFSRLCAFLAEAGRNYELSLTFVLHRDYSNFFALLRPDFLWAMVCMRPWATVYGRVSRYFHSDKMRRVWSFATMYMGMSPYKSPSPYTLLQYSEVVDGIGYPEGGFNTIMQALQHIGERSGVKYFLDSPVRSVILDKDNRSARGIRLASGEEFYADLVVLNADLVYAYNELLPPSREARSLGSRPTSCSSISFFWAFDEVLPHLKTHNIFLAEEYRSSFDSIFDDHSIPKEPSFYVNIPSRVDPTAAPVGKDAVVVLVPVGHLVPPTTARPAQDWDVLVENTRKTVLNAIGNRTGIKDLEKKIVFEKRETPLTWKSRFNLDRGAILGLSHSFSNVLSFRPKNKHPKIENLYFVGASTHPGTGVPVCLAGAKLVSQRIMRDYLTGESEPKRRLLKIFIAMATVLLAIFSWTASEMGTGEIVLSFQRILGSASAVLGSV
ncbi:phytoene dehydrogenase [Penicillium herquei]|nr:phytoene dehydrogenase [Penicillium herquei]